MADVQVPAIGSRWVWEIDKPHACAVIEVIETKYNGEEWWVKTRTILGRAKLFDDRIDQSSENWNTLDRFREACLQVMRVDHGEG